MAGGELWGVWVQTVTNDTTAANVEKYGEVEDMAQAYRDGFAKDFCDGQTSPTPPRWPDDGMQLLYFYDRESAQLVSEFLRGDVAGRIAGGELAPAAAPTWLTDLASLGLDAAATQVLVTEVAAGLAVEEGAIELTAGQIQSRLLAYIQATGNPRPSTADLLEWIRSQE